MIVHIFAEDYFFAESALVLCKVATLLVLYQFVIRKHYFAACFFVIAFNGNFVEGGKNHLVRDVLNLDVLLAFLSVRAFSISLNVLLIAVKPDWIVAVSAFSWFYEKEVFFKSGAVITF